MGIRPSENISSDGGASSGVPVPTRRAAGQPAGHSAASPNIRHRDALERAAGHLDTAAAQAGSGEGFLDRLATELQDALAALGEITGQTATEEILERIFSRFCVGK